MFNLNRYDGLLIKKKKDLKKHNSLRGAFASHIPQVQARQLQKIKEAEFQVNTQTTGDQAAPTITNLLNGGFVIAWTSYNQDQPSSVQNVNAKLYSTNVAMNGTEFQVSPSTTDNQFLPVVTGLSDGSFLIVWATFEKNNLNSKTNIYAQRYLENGAVYGETFQVNMPTSGSQNQPSVVGLPGNGFVIAWKYQQNDYAPGIIYAKQYLTNNAIAGIEFQVDHDISHSQYSPSITVLTNDQYIITWYNVEIYAQRYLANSSAAYGSKFTVSDHANLGEPWGTGCCPKVTVLENNDFIFVWQYGQPSFQKIYMQRYLANGNKLGTQFRIDPISSNPNDMGGARSASLAQNKFVITWEVFSYSSKIKGLYGRCYFEDGSIFKPDFKLTDIYNSHSAAVTKLTDGGFIAAFYSDGNALDNSGYGIYAQRFDSSCNKLVETITYSPTLKPTLSPSLKNHSFSIGAIIGIAIASGCAYGLLLLLYKCLEIVLKDFLRSRAFYREAAKVPEPEPESKEENRSCYYTSSNNNESSLYTEQPKVDQPVSSSSTNNNSSFFNSTPSDGMDDAWRASVQEAQAREQAERDRQEQDYARREIQNLEIKLHRYGDNSRYEYKLQRAERDYQDTYGESSHAHDSSCRIS